MTAIIVYNQGGEKLADVSFKLLKYGKYGIMKKLRCEVKLALSLVPHFVDIYI